MIEHLESTFIHSSKPQERHQASFAIQSAHQFSIDTKILYVFLLQESCQPIIIGQGFNNHSSRRWGTNRLKKQEASAFWTSSWSQYHI